MGYHSLVTQGPACASRRPHSRFACNAGRLGRIRSSRSMGVFGSISALSQGWTATARLWGGSLSLLVLAGACGGGSAAPAKDADDADDASEVGSSDTASAASDEESV